MVTRLSLLLLGASSALASPARIARQATVTVTQTVDAPSASSTAWNAGAVVDYPIHSSCNSTERAQLVRGLEEAIKLSQHAKDHILRWGNSSEIYQKYFGNASTGEPIGWFDKVVNGDKAGVIFRCDDPDKNCATQDGNSHRYVCVSGSANISRLGGSLAWQQRNFGNRNLPSLLRSPPSS